MSVVLPLAALQEVPFLRSPLDTVPAIVTLQFYVGGEWHCWLPFGDKLVKMQMWPVEANYFGDEPERSTDPSFPLLDMMAQRTMRQGMLRSFTALWNDFHNLSASLAKIRLYHASRTNKEYGTYRFVQSEIEYLAILCRSIFDVLQDLVRLHIANVRYPCGSPPAKPPQELPRSFREVLQKSSKDRSSDEIISRYLLPRSIAEWYVRHRDFFMQLRAIRDRIVHHGWTVGMVFSTDRGFAVSRNNDPFGGLYDWPSECELPNALVPIRPALATMVSKTIAACGDFATALSASVGLPGDLAPGLRLYSRGTNDGEFVVLGAVIAQSLWDDA